VTDLAWPFFDERHRELARELGQWCAANCADRFADDLDSECRALVREMGAAGFLKLSVADAKRRAYVRTGSFTGAGTRRFPLNPTRPAFGETTGCDGVAGTGAWCSRAAAACDLGGLATGADMADLSTIGVCDAASARYRRRAARPTALSRAFAGVSDLRRMVPTHGHSRPTINHTK
jgi:hypothetical protein